MLSKEGYKRKPDRLKSETHCNRFGFVYGVIFYSEEHLVSVATTVVVTYLNSLLYEYVLWSVKEVVESSFYIQFALCYSFVHPVFHGGEVDSLYRKFCKYTNIQEDI